MTTDLLEAQQHGPKKAVLEQVEEYQQEVLKERCFSEINSEFLMSSFLKYVFFFPFCTEADQTHGELYLVFRIQSEKKVQY